MPTYSVSQLLGKTFYAKKKIGLYKTTSSSKPYAYVSPGGYIGKLDSWIEKDSQLWFLFKYGNNEQFVIKYEPYSIDQSNLKAEGAKTVEQEAKEKELTALKAGGLTDNIEYYVRKYGLWIVGAFVAGKVIQGYISKIK
jgi:hypothetical protein